MTDQELKDLVASLVVAQAKTDEQIKAINKRMNKIEIMLGGISEITTDFFYDVPEEVDKIFFRHFAKTHCLGSFNFETIQMNMSGHDAEIKEKYDLMLINENNHGIVVCEIGFNLNQSDLNELDRKIHSFKRLNPYYQNYNLYGALAAFHLNEEVKNEALNRGFYVARIQDETFSLDSPDEFQAKCF